MVRKWSAIAYEIVVSSKWWSSGILIGAMVECKLDLCNLKLRSMSFTDGEFYWRWVLLIVRLTDGESYWRWVLLSTACRRANRSILAISFKLKQSISLIIKWRGDCKCLLISCDHLDDQITCYRPYQSLSDLLYQAGSIKPSDSDGV